MFILFVWKNQIIVCYCASLLKSAFNDIMLVPEKAIVGVFSHHGNQ